jgi:prephenate dehydrogenase
MRPPALQGSAAADAGCGVSSAKGSPSPDESELAISSPRQAQAHAVRRLAVLGCGLMGGSFALALKKARQVAEVVGWSRSPASVQQARELGVIDEVAADVVEAVRGADVVLLAVPVAATAATLGAIRDALGADALCMDVGSTKADVAAAARAMLGSRASAFVPAHPIAGKEKAGVTHADALLYRGCRTILTPVDGLTDPASVARAQGLWECVGSRVSTMEAAAHDDALAAVSHLPHLLAFAFMQAVGGQPEADRLLALAGPGFRDFTRIAAGDPTLWRDVLLANREAVTSHARAFRAKLDAMEAAMAAGDGDALRAMIERASTRRSAWMPAAEGAQPQPAAKLTDLRSSASAQGPQGAPIPQPAHSPGA